MSTKIFNPHGYSMPRVAFSNIAGKILGAAYSLSVIFVDEETSRRLNRIYRGIQKPADILSFPLSARTGEIYVSPRAARKKARVFDRSYNTYLPYLFIHGCLHLAGKTHGTTMDRMEKRWCEHFGIPLESEIRKAGEPKSK